MKKRLLTFVILIAAFCMAFPAFAEIISDETTGASCGSGLKWSYDTDTKTLTISGTGKMSDFDEKFPGMIAPWRKVTKITKNLETINILDGVTSIGEYAFFCLDTLTNVTIPNSVKSINECAFYGCSELADLTIPEGVTEIGESAFDHCTALTSVTVPGNVQHIGESAFSSCDNLASVVVEDGVQSIGAYAFDWCSNLESITLSDSVTSIGDQAFARTALYNEWYDKSELCSVLYIGNHLIKADEWAVNKGIAEGTTTSDYAVKPGTVTVADAAFYGCDALTSITLPDSVQSIGSKAFASCYGLTSITIPKNVTNLGEGAFLTCTGLTEIRVDPENTAYISENGVLYNKEKTELVCYPKNKPDTSFALPEGVTSLAVGAFERCRNLTSIFLPDGLTSIGQEAFNTCDALTSIRLPDGVTTIGGYAFFGCDALTSITIPNSVEIIGDYAFSGCGSPKKVYYNGSEADWDEILKGVSYSITRDEITFCKGIRAVQTADGIVVSPANMENGTIIVAFYDGKRLVELQTAAYAGEAVTFTPEVSYTHAKAMIWDGLNSLSPVCEAKKVK